MKLRLGLFAAALLLPSSSPAQAEENTGCVLDGVRVLIADGNDSSYVEISARLSPRGTGGASCAIDWSHVSLSSPNGADAAPTIAIAQTFVDHKYIPPLVLADGVAAANPREWRGEVGVPVVVAVRWIVEGTAQGLHVEVPRATFPHLSHPGAKVERRVKSARPGTAKFGDLGEIAIEPQPPGAAGGVGPAGPLTNERIVAEMIPNGLPPGEKVPSQLLTFDALRDTLPRRVLDLTAENKDGWDEVAKRAYAAALHGDPVVASMGVSTLAWLGSGLGLEATKIAKTASGKDTAAVPASVVDAIGDVSARLQKRYEATGKLLPLGRPSIFRQALKDRPWDDKPRSAAAKEAVAKLATVQPQDLAAFLVPPILDGASAPIDPPAPPAAIDPTAVVPMGVPDAPSANVEATTEKKHRSSAPHRRAHKAWLAIGLVALLAAIGWILRED
ncbi:MAG: hypothetical protein ACXWP4_18295 [Polyangiales bacterium]